MNKDWKKILLGENTPIIEAIKVMDTTALQIVLVIDNNGRLIGTVTDGDVRRAILKGIPFNESVQTIMFRKPVVAGIDEGRESILALMKANELRQIPIVDPYGCVTGLEVWNDLVAIKECDNFVVLMAGGLGSRLGVLTKDCPKPMLKVGNKPVLETILENCKEYGFKKFYISVNYKSEMVVDHFGDGSRWGVEIRYIHETDRLGTAGALGMFPVVPNLPILVMNADVLTKVNFQHLMDFHAEHNAVATMCVREYDFQVPYGVVKINRHNLVGIEEKPVHRFFVNAGIYVLNPECLALVPKAKYFDMPTLFEKLIGIQAETAAFPIREYWLDIGRIDDFERANGEFAEVFA